MQYFSDSKGGKNRDLIEQVILESYNRYYRLAYSYVYNEADAGDIVQNGAYKALRSSHTLKQPDYAQTWVYRIMLNECFLYLKQPKLISYEAVWEAGRAEAGGVEDCYTDIDLKRAVDSLPPKDKAIIILKYYEDKKLEEIAELLRENTNTVKSRLYRSMKKLHRMLSDETDDNEKGLNKKEETED